MSYQPFLISNFRTGVDTDLQPWLLPADAFQDILNGYIYDGVLGKRQGMSTFGWFVNSPLAATVDNITSATPGVVTMSSVAGITQGDFFQIRGETGMTGVNNTTYQVGLITGSTFPILDIYGNDVDTSGFGAFAGGGSYYPVPRNPIMGIVRFISSSGTNVLVIFDTRRACVFNSATSVFDPLDTSDIFNTASSTSSFVSSSPYGKTAALSSSYLYFTNYNGVVDATDSSQMRYWTGPGSTTTTAFVPDSTPNAAARNYINAAQFMFTIRNRLLLLNTIEDTASGNSGTKLQQRMRWSRLNDARATGNNWDQITPGNGGFEDAPTSEIIVSATLIQDRVIVFFSYSVWQIVPTHDVQRPFRWVKINSFRACDAPYGNVPHDRFIISYGKRGIVATDSVDVKRIDERIKAFINSEVNLDEIQQLYSGRNFQLERSWTLYPNNGGTVDPGDPALTSNYALIRMDNEGSFSRYSVYTVDIDPENGINMSTLGYGQIDQDATFDSYPTETFSSLGTESFSSFFFQGNAEIFVGGDQNGRVLNLEVGGEDVNSPIQFEALSAAWNPFKDQGKQSQLGFIDFYVDVDLHAKFTVSYYADDITNPYKSEVVSCLPDLGFIADVTNIDATNPVYVTAPGHGLNSGATVYLYQLNGANEVEGLEFTVTVVDNNDFTLDGIDGTANSAYISGGIVVKRALSNSKCWVRSFAGGCGSNHYIKIEHSGANETVRFNAFCPWFKISSRMIGGR